METEKSWATDGRSDCRIVASFYFFITLFHFEIHSVIQSCSSSPWCKFLLWSFFFWFPLSLLFFCLWLDMDSPFSFPPGAGSVARLLVWPSRSKRIEKAVEESWLLKNRLKKNGCCCWCYCFRSLMLHVQEKDINSRLYGGSVGNKKEIMWSYGMLFSGVDIERNQLCKSGRSVTGQEK